jgi:lysophospholipase L1-like esterase
MKPNYLPRRLTAGLAALLVLALPFVTGCEDGSLNEPQVQNDLFTSYVSLGNSITAGFQSGGINATVQNDAFPVLLAEQMGTPFGIPALNAPGCPPPIQSIPPQPPSTPCALRANTPSRVNNVAVPGAALNDVLSNAAANELTQFILGGRTQIDAALDANPTFATIWIGNNDILGPANAGEPALATPPDVFENTYRNLADSLSNNAPLEGAVAIGVADVAAVPGIFPGEVYLGLTQQIGDQLPDNFSVSPSCAPNAQGGLGSTTEISFLFALNQISQAIQNPQEDFVLGCQPDDPGALTPTEQEALSDRAEEYNETIEAIADENGWAFFNPNDAFDALQQAGEIPETPNFNDPEQPPFGQFFSLDGVHPSSVTHRVVAAQLVQVINQEYNTSLQTPENVPDLPSPPSRDE